MFDALPLLLTTYRFTYTYPLFFFVAALKQSALAGSTAHLFYLYESLTEAMYCHDPEVLLLLKACLQTAGRSLGLVK